MGKKQSTESECLIQGVGTDIIEIARIQEAIARHGNRFLNRLFTLKEQKYCYRHANPIPRFAGRFAAKEAIIKAFGTGKIEWKEMEILNDFQGKPEVELSERLRRAFPKVRLFLSISHCEDYATATAILSSILL